MNFKLIFQSLFIILITELQVIHSITKCIDHAFVTIVSIKKEKVIALLENDFKLPNTHPLSHLISEDEYPVLFEFGEQMDCIFVSKFTKHSFIEFKLEIPFVENSNLENKNFTYKSKIFVDSYLDLYGSQIMYGLNTNKAIMNIDFNSYEFFNNEGSVKVNVKNVGNNLSDYDNYGTISDYPNMTHYLNLMNAPWYCKNIIFNSVKCADLSYGWKNARIRPVELEINIKGRILGEKLDGINFKTLSISDNELGSLEMYVNIDIGFPRDC